MSITVEKLKNIIFQHMHDYRMNKREFAEKYDLNYTTLLDITSLKKKRVSSFIENKLKDVIHEQDQKIILESNSVNKDIINVINALPEAHKSYVIYYLLECLGGSNSMNILNTAISMLDENKRAHFEYQVYKLASDIMWKKKEELNSALNVEEESLSDKMKKMGND